MTCKIPRPVFAVALAIGLLTALSNPGHAALSTAERTDAAVATAPAPEQTTVAAVTAQAPAPTAAPAPAAVAATASVADQPRKTIAPRTKPRRIAAFGRIGYPCH
jgi:hypothetical protein